MARLAQTADLTDVQTEILATVRSFVDKEIIPNAQALEHADEYPQEIVDGLKEAELSEANSAIQSTITSTRNAQKIAPMMIPARARPSPCSPVWRIWRRAMMPSTSPAGANTNASTSARIAIVLVGRA